VDATADVSLFVRAASLFCVENSLFCEKNPVRPSREFAFKSLKQRSKIASESITTVDFREIPCSFPC
jgi:hypothetical protein